MLDFEDIVKITNKTIEMGLMGNSARVLLYFLAMDKESLSSNKFLVSQGEMAKKLNMSLSMVALGVKDLKEKGIITTTRQGRYNIYSFVV